MVIKTITQTAQIIGQTLEKGGYTHDTTGRYIIGLKNEGTFKFKTSEVIPIFNCIHDKIESGKNFGTWLDGEDFYIDEVVCTDCKAIALQIGLINDQISIYDTQSDITINLSEVL